MLVLEGTALFLVLGTYIYAIKCQGSNFSPKSLCKYNLMFIATLAAFLPFKVQEHQNIKDMTPKKVLS